MAPPHLQAPATAGWDAESITPCAGFSMSNLLKRMVFPTFPAVSLSSNKPVSKVVHRYDDEGIDKMEQSSDQPNNSNEQNRSLRASARPSKPVTFSELMSARSCVPMSRESVFLVDTQLWKLQNESNTLFSYGVACPFQCLIFQSVNKSRSFFGQKKTFTEITENHQDWVETAKCLANTLDIQHRHRGLSRGGFVAMLFLPWSFREKPTRPESFHTHQCLGDFKSSTNLKNQLVNHLNLQKILFRFWEVISSYPDHLAEFFARKVYQYKPLLLSPTFLSLLFLPSGCIDPPRSLPHDPRCANASQLAAPHRCCRHLNNPGGGERWHAFEIGHLFSDQGAMDQKLMISFSDTKHLTFWQPCGLLQWINTRIHQPKDSEDASTMSGPWTPSSLLEKIGCQFFIWKAWPRIQTQVIQHRSHEHIAWNKGIRACILAWRQEHSNYVTKLYHANMC